MQLTQHHSATCTVLTFSQDGVLEDAHTASQSDFDKDATGNGKRLFIIEGLSQDVVEKVGSALDIEPEFFASHMHATASEHYDGRINPVMLPSIQQQSRFWTLEYLDCIQLDGNHSLGRARLKPSEPIFRRIFIRSPIKDQDSRPTVALVNRFISLWENKCDDGNFDGTHTL